LSASCWGWRAAQALRAGDAVPGRSLGAGAARVDDGSLDIEGMAVRFRSRFVETGGDRARTKRFCEALAWACTFKRLMSTPTKDSLHIALA